MNGKRTLGKRAWFCGREVKSCTFGKLFWDDCSKVQSNVDEVAMLGKQEHLPVSAGFVAYKYCRIFLQEELLPGKIVYPAACG